MAGGAALATAAAAALNSLLIELLKKIQPASEGWPAAQRLRWFRTFAMNISRMYDDADTVHLEIKLDAGA